MCVTRNSPRILSFQNVLSEGDIFQSHITIKCIAVFARSQTYAFIFRKELKVMHGAISPFLIRTHI